MQRYRSEHTSGGRLVGFMLLLSTAFCLWNVANGVRSRKEQSFLTCFQIPHYHEDVARDENAFMIIAACPPNGESAWKARCEHGSVNVADVIPVTDVSAQVTYKNIFCAFCHNLKSFARWQMRLNCPSVMTSDSGSQFTLPAISDCTDVDVYPPLDRSSLALQQCSPAASSQSSDRRSVAAPAMAASQADHHDVLSRLGYAALFNFGFDGQANLLFTDDDTSRRVCSGSDQLYNPFELKCMRIRCPNDYMSVNGECVLRSVALGRVVQSQATKSDGISGPNAAVTSATAAAAANSTKAAAASSLHRSICVNVRLPASSARLLASSTAKFEADFMRLDVSQAFDVAKVSRVRVSLVSPLLSRNGQCTSGLYEANSAGVTNLPLSQMRSIAQHLPGATTAATAGTVATDRQRDDSQARPAGADDQRRSSARATSIGGGGEGGEGRGGGGGGSNDVPLLMMNQDQLCNATSLQPGHEDCDDNTDCIVSMHVTFHLHQRRPILNFLAKTWKKPFENLLSNSTNSACIDDVVYEDEASWCAGMTSEYFNDEFRLLWANESEIVGVRVDATNRSYAVGKFQVMVDLDKKYWTNKNVTQMAVVCDPMPTILDANCSRFKLSAEDFELLPNQSIRATYLAAQDPAFRTLPSYREIYTTDEYEYIYEQYAPSNSTDANETYVLQTCAPLDLIVDYINMLTAAEANANRQCSFLLDFARVSSIISVVCTAISLIALTITFLTYALFPALRTFAGVSIMNLTAAEFAAQLTFLLGSYSSAAPDACTALAILSHYFLLASFFWTNVMAYISYRSFGSGLRARLVQRPSDAKSLATYATYAYGVPAGICAACVGVNFGISQNLIGYGGITSTSSVPMSVNGSVESVAVAYRTMGCWIGNPLATMVSFGAPLVYCLLVNVILFVRTVYGMKAYQKGSTSRRHSSGASESRAAGPPGGLANDGGGKGTIMLRRDSGLNGRRRDPSRLSIQIRLSVLYGFSWVFGIIIAVIGTLKDPKSEPSNVACYVLYIVNFFFNLLNGSMGTFIFFAFTFNARILQLYKSKLTRRAQNPSLHLSHNQRYSSSQLTISSLLMSSSDLTKMAK